MEEFIILFPIALLSHIFYYQNYQQFWIPCMSIQTKQQPALSRQSLNQILNARFLNIQSTAPDLHSSLNKQISTSSANIKKTRQRLSLKDIQNITRSMMKDRKAHEQNVGVLNHIKGKMYCLKLGQISNFKEFSHYFYTSQYRRKMSKVQSQNNTKNNVVPQKGKNILVKPWKKMTTQPSQNHCKSQLHLENISVSEIGQSKQKQYNTNNGLYDFNYNFEDNEEEIKKIQKFTDNQNTVQDLRIDEKLKAKVHQMVLPLLNGIKEHSKGKQSTQITEGKQIRGTMDRFREEKRSSKRSSNSRML